MKTIELWRYIVLLVSYVLLGFLYVTQKLEARRLRKRIKELEDFIRADYLGKVVTQRNRLGGGSVFPQ